MHNQELRYAYIRKDYVFFLNPIHDVWMWFAVLYICSVQFACSDKVTSQLNSMDKTKMKTKNLNVYKKGELVILIAYAVCFYAFFIRRSLELARGTWSPFEIFCLYLILLFQRCAMFLYLSVCIRSCQQALWFGSWMAIFLL